MAELFAVTNWGTGFSTENKVKCGRTFLSNSIADNAYLDHEKHVNTPLVFAETIFEELLHPFSVHAAT